MDKQVRVLLVDDEALIRQGLTLLLSADPRIDVIGDASDGLMAIKKAEELLPDIVLMDIRMPKMDGREATRIILEKFSSIQVLILTTFSDMEHISQALQFGASGYLLKDSSPELIIESILAVHKGSFVAHKDVAHKILDQAKRVETKVVDIDLTALGINDGQLAIIRLIASGHSNSEIADQLYLSEGTVKNKLSVILQTLNLRDRTQVAVFAWEHGLMKQ